MERAICIPAHGAVIGAWIGAFPMPLDWERPWQVSIIHYYADHVFSLQSVCLEPPFGTLGLKSQWSATRKYDYMICL